MRPITDVLRDIRGGKVVNHASELLNELVLAVHETGKPGTFTLKLTVRPDKTGENQLSIAPTIDIKAPRPDMPESIFFFDSAGNLTRTDPNQTEMQLSRVADTGAKVPGVTGTQLREAAASA